jgi:hypothetical protein
MCVVRGPIPNIERGSFKYHGTRTCVYPSMYLLKN